jgi:DNA topoisomerase-3
MSTGTDATIAQHINTIVEREYVMERLEGNTKYLIPSTLGIGLVHGYNQIGLERSLSKPQLRREVWIFLSTTLLLTHPIQTERRMVQVCDRVKTKDDMLFESIEQYKEVFLLVRREFERVVQVRLPYIMAR